MVRYATAAAAAAPVQHMAWIIVSQHRCRPVEAGPCSRQNVIVLLLYLLLLISGCCVFIISSLDEDDAPILHFKMHLYFSIYHPP